MTDNHETLIAFAMWLTGHDRDTIEQMYRDWSKIDETPIVRNDKN